MIPGCSSNDTRVLTPDSTINGTFVGVDALAQNVMGECIDVKQSNLGLFYNNPFNLLDNFEIPIAAGVNP